MSPEISYYHAPDKDAEYVVKRLSSTLEISSTSLETEHEETPISLPFIYINGDGFFHHRTLALTRQVRKRVHKPFAYVHIDGHDDMAAMDDDDMSGYRSFVLGIAHDSENAVYMLEQGLTGKKSKPPHFISPLISPQSIDWSKPVDKIPYKDIYISIDVDVLDRGIHHLFPQSPVSFTMSDLLENIEQLSSNHNVLAADIVGFSLKDSSKEQLDESISNMGILLRALSDIVH